MRRLFVAAVAAAGLAGTLAHDSHVVSRRKTLGFGPVLPDAVFHTAPVIYESVHGPSTEPLEIARVFVESIVRDIPGSSFQVREDSYTDDATGVTHVYVRQYVNGIEVADGDINLNIKDGFVLSYGDSFFRPKGAEVFSTSDDVDPHREYCDVLSRQYAEALRHLLDHPSLPEHHPDRKAELQLRLLRNWHCDLLNAPDFLAVHPDLTAQSEVADTYTDVTHALLQFMAQATPDPSLSLNMLEDPTKYLSDMRVVFQHDLVGSGVVPSFTVEGVPDAVSPVKGRLAFVQVPTGDSTILKLVWKFEVEMKDNWYEASVSTAAPHRVIQVVDWASDSPMPVAPVPKDRPEPATYNVFAWGLNDPSEGGRSIEKENFDSLASPVGWHSLPFANDPQAESMRLRKDTPKFRNTSTTYGNNVFAHEDWEGRNNWVNNYRPDAGSGMAFDYPYSPKKTDSEDALDEAKKYINTTIAQLFYTSNMVHDLYYRYGFTEVAGNFQQHNFGRGGKEGDGVIANAQDGSGYNNANFMTPPDGQNGRCRMYLWNTANPYRDGDLEAGIVIHELSHGLSTRLTGGPANSGCLGWGESGGMGEGWGDFLATTIRSNATYSDFPMGAWAANQQKGIRNYPYSLNETVNPSVYKTLDKPGYWGVHAIGEVWAQMLWVVSNRLIAKHGFAEDLFPPKPLADGTIPTGDFYRPASVDAFGAPAPLVPKHGNSLAVQLVLDGMKLQPCRPSFFDARDAILAADKTLTGGENFCEIWEAFASRGLGVDAKVEGRTPWGGGVRTNGYVVPAQCTSDAPAPTDPTPGDGDDDDWPLVAWVVQKATSYMWTWPL
ncbi:Fungalysin metallopeptidase-domain-containing protein [Epithele typhae]|uniref:Fungalysin metallopeptidase-domain-containing protein n=1 Tax=Epithele typhae TaxID=378194 RepID=UPI0020081164|nr:Fungalysin metallopeptidase-domain-containing protein [Epithele typhae]KAH9939636.1 Fungalysin metallopeptidase-domain-containing protein [Epithele typhae]